MLFFHAVFDSFEMTCVGCALVLLRHLYAGENALIFEKRTHLKRMLFLLADGVTITDCEDRWHEKPPYLPMGTAVSCGGPRRPARAISWLLQLPQFFRKQSNKLDVGSRA
jgi:hypothetical protein